MYRFHFFIQSCFLVFVFVGPAAAQGLVKGQASADWEAANLTLPTPLQDDDQQGSGNNMVAWEYYTDGRTCDGEADAKSEQSNGSSSEYYVRKKRGTYYREQWSYKGTLAGHLEGNPQLHYYGFASLSREDNGTNGIAAAQAGGFVAYESNTMPNPVFASVLDAGMQSESSAIASTTFSFNALFMSHSVTANTVISSGFGDTDTEQFNDQIEYKCTSMFTFKTTAEILIESKARSLTNDEWVRAFCYAWGDVKGIITLSELPPAQCP